MGRVWKLWQIVILGGITLLPVIAIIITTQHGVDAAQWQIVAAVCPAIVLWLQFCYENWQLFRDTITKMRAFVFDGDVSMSMSIHFALPESLNEEMMNEKLVIAMMRQHYATSSFNITDSRLESTGEIQVDLPGWQPRIKIDTPLDHDYDVEREQRPLDLYLSMPDTTRGLKATTRFIVRDASPMLYEMERSLDSNMKSISMTLRFVEDRNPYLSMYLQNMDTDAIKEFECEIAADASSWVTIRKTTLTIRAATIKAFVNAVYRHLSLVH